VSFSNHWTTTGYFLVIAYLKMREIKAEIIVLISVLCFFLSGTYYEDSSALMAKPEHRQCK
jgi:hypothetical protein